MSSNCCSRNFSRSFGGSLRSPSSSCGSSYSRHLAYSTALCSPRASQLGSSLSRGCQETYCEPSSCHTSCVVSRPCQSSCSSQRTFKLCSPYQTTYARSVGFRSSSRQSLGCGSRRCCSSGCGSRGFRSLNYGIRGFPFLGYRSSFCKPISFFSRRCQSSCYRPTCGSGSYGFCC